MEKEITESVLEGAKRPAENRNCYSTELTTAQNKGLITSLWFGEKHSKHPDRNHRMRQRWRVFSVWDPSWLKLGVKLCSQRNPEQKFTKKSSREESWGCCTSTSVFLNATSVFFFSSKYIWIRNKGRRGQEMRKNSYFCQSRQNKQLKPTHCKQKPKDTYWNQSLSVHIKYKEMVNVVCKLCCTGSFSLVRKVKL